MQKINDKRLRNAPYPLNLCRLATILDSGPPIRDIRECNEGNDKPVAKLMVGSATYMYLRILQHHKKTLRRRFDARQHEYTNVQVVCICMHIHTNDVDQRSTAIVQRKHIQFSSCSYGEKAATNLVIRL